VCSRPLAVANLECLLPSADKSERSRRHCAEQSVIVFRRSNLHYLDSKTGITYNIMILRRSVSVVFRRMSPILQSQGHSPAEVEGESLRSSSVAEGHYILDDYENALFNSHINKATSTADV
jgi:hypothetical protein